MIVTIDGPAGAGKSTVARQLASKLGIDYLDTGALYRMVTLAAIQADADLSSPNNQVAELLRDLRLELVGKSALLNGQDVSDAIRTPEVTSRIQKFADDLDVRAFITARTRDLASQRSVVTEGRDQGSTVFPDADFKFFVTASAEERARRRLEDFRQREHAITLDEVLVAIRKRDAEDRARPVGPLLCPAEAIVIDTTSLSIEEAVDKMARAIQTIH